MNSIILLLANQSACLRYLVLRDLLKRPADDPEVQELNSLREDDSVFCTIIKKKRISDIHATSIELYTLGYLGFNKEHPAVKNRTQFLFSRQHEDGKWRFQSFLNDMEEDIENTDRVDYIDPLQTAIPLRALAMSGYAGDPRVEKAFRWLIDLQLADGAWPAGIINGVYRGIAGYRKMPQSRWGCRTNTTAALLCLAYHPSYRKDTVTQKALDLLLARETFEKAHIGLEVARLVGIKQYHGMLTRFTRYDLALVLSLCNLIGADKNDKRVKELTDFFHKLRGTYGLWVNDSIPQATHWISFDILRSLMGIDKNENWINFRPSLPFREYEKRQKRY
jgi:hypothetical protein